MRTTRPETFDVHVRCRSEAVFMARSTLNLSVGRACFTRCDGCYNFFGKSVSLPPNGTILRFLDYAWERGVSKVTLCGGDPLSRPDIVPLVRSIKALGFHISLDTVGSNLLGPTQTIFYGRNVVAKIDARELAALVDVLGIPLDGISEDSIAKFRTGRPGILSEQLAILELLSRSDAKICVNTVVHKENAAEISSIGLLISRFAGVRRWQLFQFSPTGPLGFTNRERFEISPRRFSRLVRGLSIDGVIIDAKSNARRKHSYLLIDSDGLAWVPKSSRGGRWNALQDANAARVKIGSICDPADFARIIDLVDAATPAPQSDAAISTLASPALELVGDIEP